MKPRPDPSNLPEGWREPLLAIDHLANRLTEELGSRLGPEALRLIGLLRGESLRLRQMLEDHAASAPRGTGTAAQPTAFPMPLHPDPELAEPDVILCAEDEEAVRHLVQVSLGKAGFEVLLASHGAEGAALFLTHYPRVRAVLTDINMPGKDGWHLIATIRQVDPHMKIVVMTGRLNEETHRRAKAFGVKAVIEKPLGLSDVARVMKRVLQESPEASQISWLAGESGLHPWLNPPPN